MCKWPCLRHLNGVVSSVMNFKFTVPLNLTSCVYRLLDVSNTNNSGSAVINIIKLSCFIAYRMYICLSSSCVCIVESHESVKTSITVIDNFIWSCFIDWIVL